MEAFLLLFCEISFRRTMLFLLHTYSFRLKMVNAPIPRPELSSCIFQGLSDSSKAFWLPCVCQQASVCEPRGVGNPWAKLAANSGLVNICLGALLWVPNNQVALQSPATRIGICGSELSTEIPKPIPGCWEHGHFHPIGDMSNSKIPQQWVQKDLKFGSQKTSWPPH